jgi:hypothetical protein
LASKLRAGCIVKGQFWPEPVEIKLVDPTLTVIFLSQLQNDRFAALDDTKM